MFDWIVLAVPSLIARIFIRRERITVGILQDLFVGLQLSFLSIYLTPLIQILILYDAFIDKKLHFRLEGNTFSFIFQLKEFKDSVKDLGVYRWLIPYSCLALFPLFFSPMPSILVLLGLPLFFIPSALSTDSLVILWEKQLGAIFLKPLRKSKKNFLPFVKKELLSNGEIYTPVSPEYPLFRYTHGFRGKKIAPIEINKKPHIIFLFFESLRAKELEVLGGKKEVLPNLNALIPESYFFPNFYSNSLLTFRSFFTSHYGLPYDLKMKSGLDDSISLYGLSDLLKEVGYQTNYLTGAHFDIGGIGPFLRNRGADYIFEKKDFFKKYQMENPGSWGVLDEYLFDVTLEHLEKHRDSPQFYSLLTITSHHPWIVPPSYQGPTFEEVKGAYTPKYLQTLNYTDKCIGSFVEELKKRELSKDVVLFIMGDHGVYLGENDDAYEYKRGTHKDNFHVPLIVLADGKIPHPQTVETLASQADLLPTCMDILNLKGYQHSIGKSLLRKHDNSRIFFHSPTNIQNTICCREGEKTFTSEKKHHLSPLLRSFQEVMNMFYEQKKSLPPKFEKKTGNIDLTSFRPQIGLSKKELAEEIHQKSPLISLSLNRHQSLDDDLLLQLAKWNPNLIQISMNESYRITDSGLSHLFKHCPSLLSLDISNCLLLTKECLKNVPDTLLEISLKGLDFVNEDFFNTTIPSLEILSLQHTPLTAKGLKMLSTFAPNLIRLYLSFSNFNMGEIRDSIEHLPLWMLRIEDCYSLSNEDAYKIFIPHPFLRFLSLINCHRLTDDLFHSLQDLHIKHLSLKEVPNLTDNGLEKILKLPIDSLHIMDCPKLTKRSLELAKEYSPKFQEIRVSCLGL